MLYLRGAALRNHLEKSDAVIGARNARQHNNSVQVAYPGNSDISRARPMRTKVHANTLTKDIYVTTGVAKYTPHVGHGDAEQYLIEIAYKPSFVDTERIIEYID